MRSDEQASPKQTELSAARSGAPEVGGHALPYAPPPETRRLIDELYREELREARTMAPEEKLLLGEELFAYACSITLAGIQNQFPEADEAEQRRILVNRLELQRKLEERP
jgi:hypothetical protein